MRLKKITLNNIRSYEHQEIEFPEGSTLLSGDIGSGKTSILLGIEFGLFGLQPGQRGAALLRNSAKEGGVKIEFEVDGKQIMIERDLKRGKTVNQDYVSITIDNEKTETSVTELKNTILDLLNYPKEFSKKQNILYKFTVYTPQEEMKQIILQDSETRVNTLRHVFGIDKYKKIIENTSILAAKLREEKRIKEALTANLEQEKLNLVEKENDLEDKYYTLSSVEKELFLKQETREKIQEEKQTIQYKIEEKNKLQQEIEKTKIMISNKNDSILSNKKIIKQIQEQMQEMQKLSFDEKKILYLQDEIQTLKKQKQELNDKNIRISSQIHSLEVKNSDNLILKTKLYHLDTCPTCLQEVSPVYKANVTNKLDNEFSQNKNQIQELAESKKQTLVKTAEVDSQISIKEKQTQELNILRVKLQGLEEKQIRLSELEKLNISLEKDTAMLNNHIETLKKNVFDLLKFDNIFEEKQRQLDMALTIEKQAEIKVAELKREIQVFSRQIDEIKIKIQKTQDIQKQLKYISELEDWLTQKFIPLISFIEKNVMLKLKSEFSKLFAEWFSMLVSDNFNVRLDDEFTPIIEQQDYEIDYAYLSGGERTAIALAYRLSLNQVINSLLSKIKTRDLVILDEPTDGFSEQQLDKMRDVLQELNVAQLIIVSHEQKIESFVENVIRFRKDGGVSRREN
mgnify:CR=1 FL=1